MVFIPLFFAAAVGLADYYSNSIRVQCGSYFNIFSSAAGGVTVAYLFVQLLPEFVEGVLQLNKLLFLSVLAGFSMVHVIEKYIYQHSAIRMLKKELAVEDSSIQFVYSFIIGLLLVEFWKESSLQLVLLFVPVLLHSAMSGLPLDTSDSKKIQIFPAIAPLLGGFYAWLAGGVPDQVKFTLIGIITGALIFSVTRHHLPFGKRGSPEWFIIGVLAYSAIIVASWVYLGLVI